jgi:hypothetical protein
LLIDIKTASTKAYNVKGKTLKAAPFPENTFRKISKELEYIRKYLRQKR